MTRPFPTARSLAVLALSAAMVALAACSGDAPASDAVAPADPALSSAPVDGAPAEAISPDAPMVAEGDLSAMAVGDVVLVDRTQMADQPCHGMANTVMGNCTTQEEIDAAIATMSISNPVVIDRNQMADQPCHVMAGMVMGNCTLSEAQTKVDEVRASR